MIKSFSLLVLVLFLVLSASSRASDPTDLGHGLIYLRVDALSAPIKSSATTLILDLRYVTTDSQAAAALKTLLAQQPNAQAWFILVSPATPIDLAPIIDSSPAITLGAPDSIPTPQVIVRTDAATDRRAYDALSTGTPLTELISGKIEKERYDEASLVKDFKQGIPEPDHTPPTDPTANKSTDGHTTTPPAIPARLTDRVLQRAVQLHAAMRALKPQS